MSKDYTHKIFTIPNILSMFRVVLIPVMVWLYAFKDAPKLSCMVLILSGITDIVDGFIARRYNMISNFGKALDPVADKLTQFVLLVSLCIEYPEMVVPCGMLTIKEIISGIVALRTIHRTGKVDGANWHGKLSTVILYAMIFTHILWKEIPGAVSIGFISASVVIMLYSCIMYNIRNLKAYRVDEHKSTQFSQ